MEPPAPRPVAPEPGGEPSRVAPGSTGRLLLTLGAFVAAIALVAGAIWIVPNLAGAAASPAATGAASAAAFAPASPAASSPASASAQPLLTPVPTTEISLPPATAGPPISLSNGRTLAKGGAIALVGTDNSLTLVDSSGKTVVLAPASTATFAFPAWSPDGTKLAAIRADANGGAILVFDAKRAIAGEAVQPTVIFRSASIGPFYADWTPDGKAVSFLADDPDVLSLRIAPADGSAPLDGSGPGAKISSGNPFYFDWLSSDRILAHIGTGSDSFLGEIGRDGAPVAPQLSAPGPFRSAAANRDGSLISYVRTGAAGATAVVVAQRNGSGEHTMPVFGTAGMAFDPTGDTLASIGPVAATTQQLSIPIGPLRLLDPATGKVRTLLDGDVVSFWWSPDGRTIAALRVQPEADGSSPSAAASSEPAASQPAASQPAASAPPPPSAPAGSPGASIPPPTDAYLVFVDVQTGRVQSQSIVHPSQIFIDQFLTFFDQYAISHRIWAPDSSSVLVPITDAGSETRLAVMPRNGDQRILIDGEIGFWSP